MSTDAFAKAMSNSALLTAYDSLLEEKQRARMEKSEFPKAQADLLTSVTNEITKRQKVILITPEKEFENIPLIDKVHDLNRETRLGYEGQNKRAYALAIQKNDGVWHPNAVVYTYFAEQESIPGKIIPILEAKPQDLKSSPTYLVPYSISSSFPGAGRDLLFNLHEAVYSADAHPVITTLSPLRTEKAGFKTWLDQQGLDLSDATESHLRLHTLRYLMEKTDPVQNFHMNNGAYIEAIQTGNTDSSKDNEMAYGVMVNYKYVPSRETMGGVSKLFNEKSTLPFMSAALLKECKDFGLVSRDFNFPALER